MEKEKLEEATRRIRDLEEAAPEDRNSARAVEIHQLEDVRATLGSLLTPHNILDFFLFFFKTFFALIPCPT